MTLKSTLKITFVIACTIILLILPLQIAASTTINDTTVEQAAQEDWPSIIDQLEHAKQLSPGNQQVTMSLANAYNNYALVLAKQKQWQQAEDYLQDAINTNPTNDAIKKNLSAIYFSHAYDLYQNYPEQNYTSYRFTTAKQLVTQAIATDGSNVNAYLLLGDIEYANQNLEAAAKAWQRAANLDPSDPAIIQRMDRISREAASESTMDTKYNMYFIIKVDPKVEKLAGFDINETLDNTRNEVSRELNYTQNIKIPVLVYTVESYKSSIPDAPDWSEGAFDGKLRIVLTTYKNNISLLKSTIVHEYTHAVIADLTKGNIPRWFNEGIAKYMEYKYGIPPRINYLAQAYNSNNIIAWNEIDTAIISPNPNLAMLAYQQSFNFIYYLVQRYGMIKLRTLLDTLGTGVDFNTAVNRVYNVPLETIQHNWALWLPDYIMQWAEAPIPTVTE